MKIKKYSIKLILLLMFPLATTASDHLDSAYIDTLPKADIGDLFLWTGAKTQSPVFMISLNPLVGPEQPSARLLLGPNITYEFKIDTNDDSVADIAYKITVTGESHPQDVTLLRATGDDAISMGVDLGSMSVVARGKSTPPGKDPHIIEGRNDELLFVGARQDPFFFNFAGVLSPVALDLRFALSGDGLPSDGTAKNTFGPTNITAITLEVPDLQGKKFGSWATTSIDGKQVDRVGRASITAIFIPSTPSGRNSADYPYNNPEPPVRSNGEDRPKQIYNTTEPKDDRRLYSKVFEERLKQLQAKDVEGLVNYFLPDIQGYDPKSVQAYPNGRNLEEDAVYWMIKKLNPFLFQKGDSTLPHRNPQSLTDAFPYAASPVGY